MDTRGGPAADKSTANLKSIVCSNLHEDLNKRSILVNHFSQFGEIEGITCSKVSKYAVINFSTHAEAKAAKEKGALIDRNFAPVELYLSAKSASSIGPGSLRRDRSIELGRKRLTSSSSKKSEVRSGAKLSSNFLQSNIRAYLGAKKGKAEDADAVAEPEGSRVSAKPRINRFAFKLPSTLPTSSPPRMVAQDNESEWNEEFTMDVKPAIKAPQSSLTAKPFTFKSAMKNKAMPSPVVMGDEYSYKTEAQPQLSQVQEIQHQLSSVDNADLQELVYKRAATCEDRYRILDARDKLLRMKNPKVKVRVEFAVRLAGTCPDMCPEKERYMREFQRQLKDYECLSPTGEAEVDHRKAVKQYSRSSADQEEPLPHELRPVETLDMTMSYLLHNIVNRSEIPTENLLEWYGFMWDRTRSIRKDITQQQICDLKSVTLMETCTRFHIHCSTRLCELDRHAFDPKLNDENLMKCLQSLEHMYGDLHVKGVQCPNEPEFRSYQILMNLNEGDILWEIQQKPISVLRSPAVQHALKIHLALSQKNFVAFFRLVRNSSYMTSCILHRYFYQVRSFALRRLIRAHSIPQFQTTMPATSIQQFLGFGPDEGHRLLGFCEAHGIHYDEYSRTVLLSSKRIVNPEAPLMHREHFLIESKLNRTVAEAIKGEELGQNPLLTYNPHSSFDAQGYLLKSDEIFTKLGRKSERIARAPETSLSLRKSPEKQIVSTGSFAVPAAPAPLPGNAGSIFGKPTIFGRQEGLAHPSIFSITGHETQTSLPSSTVSQPFPTPATFGGFTPSFATSKSIFGSQTSIPSLPSPVTGPTFGAASSFGGFGIRPSAPAPSIVIQPPTEDLEQKMVQQLEENYKQAIFATVLIKAVSEEIKTISENTISQAKEEARREEQQRAFEGAISQSLSEQIERDAVHTLVTESCSQELSHARNIRSISEEIGRQLENTVSQSLIGGICSDVYKQAKIDRENDLKRASRLLRRVQLSIWIQHWKAKASEKKLNRQRLAHKRRSDIEHFPPCVSYSLSPATILNSWCMLRTSPVAVRLDKTRSATRSLDMIEKSEKIHHSFTTYLEEFSPTMLNFILDPLRERLEVTDMTNKSQFLHPISLPPVVFNILLMSENEQDACASWIWNGFLNDCKETTDPNVIYRHVSDESEILFISIQKVVLEDEETWRNISSNTAGVILFLQSEDLDLHVIQAKLRRPVSLIVLNSSSASLNVIRKRLRAQFLGTGLIDHFSILDTGNDLVEIVPMIADAFNSFGHTLPLVTPLQPRFAFPSLATLAQFVIMEVFPKCTKHAFCVQELFQAYNQVLAEVITVVEKSKHLGYATEWPDAPTELIAEVEPHLSSLLPPKAWRTISEKGQLQSLVKHLELEFPQKLYQLTHQSIPYPVSQEEVGLGIADYVQSICREGVPSLELMTMSQELARSVPEGNLFIMWKQFLHMCQMYRIKCLEKATRDQPSQSQVCVSVPHLLNLSVHAVHGELTGDGAMSGACRTCSASKILAPRRKRSLTAGDMGNQQPQTKSRKSQNSILSDIYAFIHEVKQEKDCLLQD